MFVEILILSILRHGPMHGYELKQRIRQVTLNELSNNSLYPILRRFEQNGIATKTVEAQEDRPARKVYRVTEKGRTYFADTIRSLPPDRAASDEEFLVRVSFFGEMNAEERAAIIRARDAVLAERLADLRALAAEPGRTANRSWRDETTRWFIERLTAEREWLAELATKAGD